MGLRQCETLQIQLATGVVSTDPSEVGLPISNLSSLGLGSADLGVRHQVTGC